jgi:carboxyl-terminal processing protease
MDPNSRDRLKAWTPLFFSLVLIFGMVIGFNLRDTLRNKRSINTIVDRNDRLEEIIDLINEKYVDTVNNNILYKDAVSGILKPLDPHTVYIPADELQSVNDDLDGGFSGIGVEFSIVRDTIEVTSVIENGPAGNAGIEIGDQIIKVGDSLVAGKNITSDRIVHLLKGRQRSSVSVTVKQVSNGLLKQCPITRDIIPIYSVEASIMLDANTGFIKINRFSATSNDEFSAALKKLQSLGAKQLILDLRDNPGGYIDAATAIADNFLDDNKLIVYTKGLHSPKTEYKAGEKGVFENGRLAILVDESSASASEILAGAIQDWDRGVVIGRRTFGKGLVQEQYEMPDGAALRLTIAKYYTPSGRCIQRSFARGREAYMEDYEKRFESGELIGKDTATLADTIPFYTSRHRIVYGGGGIKPDVYVPYDTSLISTTLLNMVFSQELKTAIWDYFIYNRNKLKFKDITDFNTSFNAQQQVAGNYLATLSPDTRKSVLKELSKPSNDDYFRLQIKAQLARFLFHDNGYYTISLKSDEVVNKALAILNSGQYSDIIKGK